MAKCLVVGGSGFVGRELVRQLAAQGDDVFTFQRSERPRKMPGTWLRGDITQPEGIHAALGDHEFDVIYHTASLPGDTGSPSQMVGVNIVGLTNMLIYARDTHVKRFVLTSSISALEWYPATKFNPPDYMPVDEEHPARPKDMYASTKRSQEILALTFYHQYSLPVTVLRLVAVVGREGQGGARGYRELAEMMAAGGKARIPHFSMDELCHYVDVRDVARLHIVAGEHPDAVGQIFNCAAASPTRGREFADVIERLVPGIEAEVGFPWSMAQGGEISISMEKAKRLLGFEPQYTLEDALRDIKTWIDEGGLDEGERLAGDEEFTEGEKLE